MNRELIAERLIELADEYLSLGVGNLQLTVPRPLKPGTVEIFDGDREWLRIQFFFPGIADKGCALLMRLRERQLSFTHHKSVNLDALPTATSIDAAACSEYSEANFEQLKEEVETKLLPSTSPVQQIILRKVFLTVPDSK